MNNAENDRKKLLDALKTIWPQEPGVKIFGLAFLPDRIEQSHGGWVVPIISGVATGSARELARTLDHLQDEAEARTSLSISLYLDPFAPTSNGVGKH